MDILLSLESLSVRDSVRRRSLLQSGFYRYLWPHIGVAEDMNLKTEYSSTANGSMYSNLGRRCRPRQRLQPSGYR